MASSTLRFLSAAGSRVNLTLKSRHLTPHISLRHIQEFPETRFNNTIPKDYLLVLPEKLNDIDNEILRIPRIGEPEVNFSELNTEVCFKGLSQALCMFENFLTDVENQVSPPYNNINELILDIEKHLIPLDSAYNILMVMRTICSEDYSYKEIHELVGRYYQIREKRTQGSLRNSLLSFSKDTNLKLDDKKMLRLYHISDRDQTLPKRSFEESSMLQIRKNLQSDVQQFLWNLQVANREFAHTIDDPDILAAVSSDFDDCQDLHHKERTPLQITAGTYPRFMQVCPDRFVRQRMWQTINRRCSPKGPVRYNNLPLIKNIRVLRRKLADMSGYRSHLDFRLQDTMASTRKRVMDCLNTTNQENFPKLQDRLQELTEYAYDNKHEDPTRLGLQEYDIDYWSNRYLHDILIGISEPELKSFFPFKTVMDGLVGYFKKFLSIDMKITDSDRFWSDRVRLFELSRKGKPLGNIVYDPFNRSSTNSCETIQARLRNRAQGSNYLPARVISTPFKNDPTCNDANLSVMEVIGLFNLFSSTIQDLLLNYTYYELNTYGALEPDVVELLPRLCLTHIHSDPRILQSCSSRSNSKPIDSELANRILKAMSHFSPFDISKQLYRAHLDHEAHVLLRETRDLVDEIHTRYSPFPRSPDDYDFCAMTQIFIGPNDGTEYSNLWSRQLAKYCLSQNRDSSGKLDETKVKDFYDKLIESLYVSTNQNTDEKLTSIIGKRFEPSELVLGVH